MLIDCARVRTSLLSDPHADSENLRLHLQSCAECARYAARLREFETRLGRAFRVDLPRASPTAADPPAAGPPGANPPGAGPPGADPPGSRAEPTATVVPIRPRSGGFGWPGSVPGRARFWRGRLAAAASVALAVVVAGALWIGAAGRSLAADVVGHMRLEPQAWTVTHDPVPQPALDQVLQSAHLRLKPGAGMVSYAQSCAFRGHEVPHLVVQTDDGPVTVMLLIHEKVGRSAGFDENGYRGIIVPIPDHGSLAVLEKDSTSRMPDVQRVAAQVLRAIEWTT